MINIRSFENDKLNNMNVPMRIVRLISKINEYKGKQDLYNQQSPQILNTLKEVAIIHSTKASNEIEGIKIQEKRLIEILKNKDLDLRDRSESEIIGYKNVLDTIHSSAEYIPINTNYILQFHRDLYRFHPRDGGRWKNGENVISEKLPDGTEFIRFKPVSSFETPEMMNSLCQYLNKNIKEHEVEPLILIAAFILDFLCIHPFNDGNGRMARLLTLLLLYKFDYEVGRFISLEKIVEETKEMYYKTLYESSQNWHEGNHDITPWLEYFLGIVVAAYKDFEDRVGVIDNHKGNKGGRVENTIENIIGEFTKDDLRIKCPDVGDSTINRVLAKLRDEDKIELVGTGRNAKWIRKY